MSDDDPTVGNHRLNGRRAGGRKAVMLMGVVAAAFAAWVGLRLSGAVTKRDNLQKEQTSAANRLKEQASRPPTVEVLRGGAATWDPAVPFEGTLSAQKEADLGFKAPGRLAQIRAKVGDKVRAGQVLATLSVDEAQAQLAAAQAQLAAARAQAALATDSAKRTAQVVATGAQSEAAGVQAEKQKQLA